jgi:hypothetical protein
LMNRLHILHNIKWIKNMMKERFLTLVDGNIEDVIRDR